MIICPKRASSGINFQQILEDEVHIAIEMTPYWVLTQKLNVWDQAVCSHILQQRLHLFAEWDGAFMCHSCESHTTELRKQFIPAEDTVQFLWKKKVVLQQQRSRFLWYQSERSTVMGDGSLNAQRWGADQGFMLPAEYFWARHSAEVKVFFVFTERV